MPSSWILLQKDKTRIAGYLPDPAAVADFFRKLQRDKITYAVLFDRAPLTQGLAAPLFLLALIQWLFTDAAADIKLPRIRWLMVFIACACGSGCIAAAKEGFRRMFNEAGGYFATSLKQQDHVGQDSLYGAVLTFAVFGERLVPDVALQEGENTADPRLQNIDLLQGMRALRFTVTDVSGAPLSDTMVFVLDGDPAQKHLEGLLLAHGTGRLLTQAPTTDVLLWAPGHCWTKSALVDGAVIALPQAIPVTLVLDPDALPRPGEALSAMLWPLDPLLGDIGALRRPPVPHLRRLPEQADREPGQPRFGDRDRKSTRLNSSHRT